MNIISFKGLPSNTRYVANNLIVGAKQGLSGLRKLRDEQGVNIVIDVRKKKPLEDFYENLLCKVLHLKKHKINLTFADKKINPKDFIKIAEIIEKNKGGKTFLHCRHGKHRSVMAAAISLMKSGVIKSKEEFEKFLTENYFYEVTNSCFLRKIFPQKTSDKKIKNLEKVKNLFEKLFFKS